MRICAIAKCRRTKYFSAKTPFDSTYSADFLAFASGGGHTMEPWSGKLQQKQPQYKIMQIM